MTNSKTQGADSGGRYSRDEDLKPSKQGEPPRPATEPRGTGEESEESPSNTDRVTGRPNRR